MKSRNQLWRFRPAFITDGKVYLENTEHNPYDPQHRGCPFLCLDLETGELVFQIAYRGSEWSSTPIIGDSIISMYNEYDQRIYAIGKGPSATTTSIQDNIITEGDSALVTGMVTDISPGTEDYILRARFPNGVPAVCDANMSDWMMYVHNQFERPSDILGVNVTVTVLDPNGNCYAVGTAVSDANGKFSIYFTPEVPGKYTVIVTFDGSESYYGSWDETDIMVEMAPAATAPPTPTPGPMTDTYVLGLGAGAIIAIVAIGLVIILMLRKR